MLNETIVDVHIVEGKIYGTIACVLCNLENKASQKPKRVSYYESPSACYWVLSNFQKHLTGVHHLKGTPNRNKRNRITQPLENIFPTNSINISNHCIDGIEVVEEVKIFEQEEKIFSSDEQCNWLFKQLADQIGVMTTAVLVNSENQESMQAQLENDTIYVTCAKIQADGNCMFGSLAHQLHQYPINSDDHHNATKKLRAEVVEYILDPQNFASFQFILQDRVYDIKSKNQIEDMATECKMYVRHVLSRESQSNSWGGQETLKAVSEIYRVNIITINENGTCVIAIAWRTGFIQNGKEIRNHYDSISDISANDIYTVANFLINRKN